ncbi:hypothetical protein H6F67_01510 [Microcoleus sp. FACHB-1515]|uniref:hypothetical protein n=1 Tax=Cyanophyceae TaxID=3028117 RepID=UPI0016823153|nr:hypothetical protein [Microcoleus sp. FACHB-1515]MBD2088545.1 hypothetical protein [Microcoleus sp. FACHB-1515]
MQIQDYPFVQELVTDMDGQVRKVILRFEDYQRLLEALEDEGLYRAMQEVAQEQPLSLEEALDAIDRP